MSDESGLVASSNACTPEAWLSAAETLSPSFLFLSLSVFLSLALSLSLSLPLSFSLSLPLAGSQRQRPPGCNPCQVADGSIALSSLWSASLCFAVTTLLIISPTHQLLCHNVTPPSPGTLDYQLETRSPFLEGNSSFGSGRTECSPTPRQRWLPKSCTPNQGPFTTHSKPRTRNPQPG